MQSLECAKKLVYDKYSNNGHIKRFEHILGVVEMATYLAKLYNVDVEKAQIAAYMHDYHKYESNEELETLIKEEDILECRKFPVLYHSYASAEAYKRLIGDDIEIYEAIRNHVFGVPNMTKLQEIILISDYTEKNRPYQSCIECREYVLNNKLYKAIYESTLYTIEYIGKKGLKPHPMQIEVLNYYKKLQEEEL